MSLDIVDIFDAVTFALIQYAGATAERTFTLTEPQ